MTNLPSLVLSLRVASFMLNYPLLVEGFFAGGRLSTGFLLDFPETCGLPELVRPGRESGDFVGECFGASRDASSGVGVEERLPAGFLETGFGADSRPDFAGFFWSGL